MSNREYYHRTFSKLQTSRDYLSEVQEMSKMKIFRLPKVAVAAIIAIAATIGTTGICYAANIGGIQRQIQLLTMGDKTNAVMDYKSNDSEQSEAKGNARNKNSSMPELNISDDGTHTLYYQGHSMDITKLFDNDGYCYVTLSNQDTGKKEYVTISKSGSVVESEKRYLLPGKDFSQKSGSDDTPGELNLYISGD